MPVIDPVRIDAVADVIRSLRRLRGDLPKTLSKAAMKAAGVVVDAARVDVPTRSGKARGSIRARPWKSAAKIEAGGPDAPYFPWLDFGGRVGRRKSVKRPYIADGRYLYPAFRASRDRFEVVLRDALVEAAHDAGLEIR